MFPTMVHSLSNNIFAGQRGVGKGTHFQDVSPSFNYKCSWLWHSCNWGADLCQIISIDVRGWSPRGRGGQAEAAAPPTTPGAGAADVSGFSQKHPGVGWEERAQELALHTESLLCTFLLCDLSLRHFPSLSINFLLQKKCI